MASSFHIRDIDNGDNDGMLLKEIKYAIPLAQLDWRGLVVVKIKLL